MILLCYVRGSFIISFEINSDAKKAIVEIVEEEETVPVPQYNEADLRKLFLYIQQIATSYDLNDDDISESFMENVRKWLLDVMEVYLFAYFENGFLCASLSIPTSPISQLTYFIREELGHVFSIEGFHDEITFGTIYENIDEAILMLFNCIYIPKLKESQWSEKIKQNLFIEIHSFMAHLTDINSKIGSMVILYVPNEGQCLSIEQAVFDKSLIKRFENVISSWISQIQLCINDMKYLNQNTLPCPSDEYDFWVYKCKLIISNLILSVNLNQFRTIERFFISFQYNIF